MFEVLAKVVTLTQRTDKLEQAVKNQPQELRELTAFAQQLAFELQRLKDEQKHAAERDASERKHTAERAANERKHAAERAANERKLFQLAIENQWLKFARRLPPHSEAEADD